MLYIKRHPPWVPFSGRKNPSWFYIYSDSWLSWIDSEVMDFNEMYNVILNTFDDLNREWVCKFLTTYGKNKREKIWDIVKFYFIMDGEPWYDNDEYEFIFEDTFESL